MNNQKPPPDNSCAIVIHLLVLWVIIYVVASNVHDRIDKLEQQVQELKEIHK